MKLIDYYKIWMESGEMNRLGVGLCGNLPFDYRVTLELFDPNDGSTFWAYPLTTKEGGGKDFMEIGNRFTELRQTIVLFICAMHGEL